jgi:hypothetical protein
MLVTYVGDISLRVVNEKSIMSVVAMVPHPPFPGALDRYFVVEKPGLDITVPGGVAEFKFVPDE